MNGGFKYEVGMFGGSFDPLHQGHLNVIYRAASECRELYLVLSHSPNRDSVGYRTRAKWLHLAIQHLDNVRILLLEDDCKSKEEYNTSEHWAAGARQVQEQVGKRIDVVYCGSDHAAANEYARVYPDSEIKFVDRAEIAVSSTEIRKSPSRFWDFLPEFVRPQYVRKVLIVGSESTGKSVMARTLANLYSTVCVEEYGRRVCEACGGEAFDDCNPLDPNGEWEVTGGGGTDFRPVFEYIDEHQEINPDLLIFFTDGYGAYPERAPAYPVLWLLTADGQCSVDWGTQVRFKAEGK